MSKPNLLNRITLGIKRRPGEFILAILVSFASLWGILEPIVAFFPSLCITGAPKFLLFLAISLAIGIYRILPAKAIEMRLKNTNSRIKILFADLFTLDGHKVIPANEFFDSEIGDPVSPNSLHGKFILNALAGQSQTFDSMVAQNLAGTPHEADVPRARGKTKRYPLGTTAAVELGGVKYFLFALSKTDIATFKASADVPQM